MPSANDFTMDGCVVTYESLPGGRSPYGLGKTLTHEIGHWFNLRHTFEGGCSGPGDFVDDTPAQGVPTFGCPNITVPDTCPSPGLDPIHNYMNYVCEHTVTPTASRGGLFFSFFLHPSFHFKVAGVTLLMGWPFRAMTFA